jgi:hypothetical protein
MSVIWIALVVAPVSGLVGPLLLARLTDKQRRADKLQDWARQDRVAAQAAKAAQLLLERQDAVAAQAAEAAQLLLAANERVAAQSADAFAATQAQLGQIHLLVNSNLTEAQRRELEATVAMLVTMKEVVDLKQQGGIEPSPEALAAIRNTQERVDALTRDLNNKVQQTRVADAQITDLPSQRRD